jgi:putative transposase
VARRRAAGKRVQPRIDAADFVCIDETWTKTNMAPLYGWSPVGERCLAHVPHGHWKTQTCIAGLTPSGIIAPFVLDGPINGESFLAYVEQVLAPELSPKNTVILDNLGSHKSQAVRQAIRKTGARLLFLPPYSPDLNPIEQAFAKFKHMLRKARQRSIDTVWKAVGQILQSFLPEECRNYFINAGWVRLNS